MEKHGAMSVIAKAIDRAGSQSAFAEANDMSAQYVNDVVRGRKEPSRAILDAVGLERVVMYRRKASAADTPLEAIPERAKQ